MKRFLPAFGVALVVGLTIVSGIIHGRMSNRWGLSEDLIAVAKKLEEIPSRFGNWRLESSQEMGQRVVDVLQCAGYIFRVYVNEETGQRISVSIICGPSGPTSVHTAEICYDTRGNTILEERQRVTIQDSAGSNHQFWSLNLEANNIHRDLTHVYYGWSPGGPWLAPDHPRVSLARYRYLYKLEVSAVLPAGTDLKANDPGRDFLRDFVPVANGYMGNQSDD